MRLFVSLVAATTALCAGSPAWAFPSARLEYVRETGTDSCPDEAELRKAVADRLGYDPFDSAAPDLLRTRVSRGASRFSAVLELVDPEAQVRARRTLDSASDCAELVAAMALSMSIVIDPERALRAESQGAEPSEPPAASVGSAASTPAAVAPEAPAKTPRATGAVTGTEHRARAETPLATNNSPYTVTARAFRVRLGAALHASFGAEPALAPGASLQIGLRRGAWSLALEGRYDSETSRSIAPRGTVYARLLAAALVPCIHSPPLLFCAVGMLGSLEARASDVSTGRADSALFAAAGARLGLEWKIAGPFALRASGDALLTARPLSGQVNDASVWDVPVVTGLLTAGFIAEF